MPKQDRTETPQPSPAQIAQIKSLQHRMQSGIAFLEGRQEVFGERFAEIEPKHLRVGINMALLEGSALAALMFRKGLIEAEEYFDVIIEFLDMEVMSYSRRIKAIDGRFAI